VSMRERAQRWGGRVAAGPRPTGGWTVAVTLPHLRTSLPEPEHDLDTDPAAGAGEDATRDGAESGR